MSSLKSCLQFLIILQIFSSVSCKWCTRLKGEKTVHQVLEMGECTQRYQAKCGWFSSSQCTYYETVPCHKERNRTVVEYRIVSECCHGYRQDPVSNVTCIRIPGSHENNVHYYVSDDELFLGLSPGAYAGIGCSFIFMSCVTVLVTVHMLKRKKQNLKAREAKAADREMSAKMIEVSIV